MSQGLNIGSLLDHGKYRVEKVLGQGGFGITYLVVDLGLDKLRAVKEFFPKDYCQRDETTSHISLGTSNTAEFVERLKAKFIKEARNIANLDQHHGIIRIHTVFEENNTAYYVMDYIEGESLSAMVKRDGPIPVEKAIKYIKGVGEALEYVHSHNINHLDIKPANLMIRKKEDKPILIDFGLAKQYDSDGFQTSTTPTGISHGFAPFEQYRDGGIKEFSPQTDVYSLAATLYYLISGQVPPHATELIENELTFPPSFPGSLRPVIRKAMSTKRQNRPETVRQFLASLDSSNMEQESTIIAVPVGNKTATQNKPSSSGSTGRKKEESKSKDVKAAEEKVSSPKPSERRNNFHKQPGKDGKRFNIAIVALILVSSIVFCFFIFKDWYTGTPTKLVDTTEDSLAIYDEVVVDGHYVNNYAYETPLGLSSYTGEVDLDSLPNGKGIARWATGDPLTYDGEWVHGLMEGQTNYTLRNGDTFVGTFKGGRYQNGRYTIKEDGSYFEGSFKNGQPDKGTWYDKSGNKL